MAAGRASLISLAGRTALVTGATGRLGRTLADTYCAAGAQLLLNAKEEQPLQALVHDLRVKYSIEVAAVACDLSSDDGAERLVEEVRRRFSGLDVLINAAAIIGPIGPTWDIAWADWRRAVETNLFAAVRLCQLCVPLMPQNPGRGKIVNLSGGGATSPRPGFSAYAAAKTGLVRFTETLAHEVAGRRIDVNCVAPGMMNSRLTRAVVEAGVERAGRREYDVAVETMAQEHDQCQRAAELVLFLGSSLSDGISGRLLSAVWDDWPALRADSPALQDPAVYTLRRVLPAAEAAAQDAARTPAVTTPLTPTPMTVCVAGLWHLGCVTAACLAAVGHRVLAYDTDATVVANLKQSRLPINEPGVAELMAPATTEGRLTFSEDAATAVGQAGLVWVTWDTPVDELDRSDVDWVLGRVEQLFPHLRDGALVLVSSQLPAGSIAELERRFAAAATPGRTVSFACIPENLQLGKSVDRFMHPDGVVVGIRTAAQQAPIAAVLAPFTTRIEWMKVESAEMTKHAINAFLAASVAFINEIGSVCEEVGADATEVSRGLRLDRRIGPKAYLSPGGPFSGGTLARDVVALTQLASGGARPLNVIGSIRASNDQHRLWTLARLRRELGPLLGRTIAIWGLTYKPGTDTLRRSGALELSEAILAEGAIVRAYDPAVSSLPPHLASRITLTSSAVSAAEGADALVIATEWPEFLTVATEALMTDGHGPVVLDANGFLAESFGRDPRVRYVSVGRL